MNIYILKHRKNLLALIFLIFIFIVSSKIALSDKKVPRISINGSGLEIPRMVSLKNSLTYMRTGPGKDFPVKFELKKKGYPLKIVAEYNNWRKVVTFNKISGWVHTQLLSSFRTGLITKTTFLKPIPSYSTNSSAKLLPNLLVNIVKCDKKWCKIKILKTKVFEGWIQKEALWGSIKN